MPPKARGGSRSSQRTTSTSAASRTTENSLHNPGSDPSSTFAAIDEMDASNLGHSIASQIDFPPLPPSPTASAPPEHPLQVISPPAENPPPDTVNFHQKLHVICTTTPQHATQLHALSPAARARAIFNLVGDIDELRILNNGDLLLIAKTEDQVKALLTHNSLADIPVRFHSPATTSRVYFGVLSGVPIDASEDDLSDILKATNATGFIRLRRRDTTGRLVDTTSLRLAFASPPPATVLINYVKTPIKPFTQRLLQCYNCCRYGHVASSCRSNARCGRCAEEGHATTNCTSPSSRCALCAGDHTVWSPRCPLRQQELEFERRRATSGLSYWEAKKQLRTTSLDSTAPAPPFSPPTQPFIKPTYASAFQADTTLHKNSSTNPQPDGPDVQQDNTVSPTTSISHLLRLLCTLLSDQPICRSNRTTEATTQTALSPPTTTPCNPEDHSMRTLLDSASQTSCPHLKSSSSQTSTSETSDDSTVTEPVIVIRQPPCSLLYPKEDTGGEETVVFPLTDLSEYTALIITLLDERRSNHQRTTPRALTRLALDRFFTDVASE